MHLHEKRVFFLTHSEERACEKLHVSSLARRVHILSNMNNALESLTNRFNSNLGNDRTSIMVREQVRKDAIAVIGGLRRAERPAALAAWEATLLG